jgi:hypothetical protein
MSTNAGNGSTATSGLLDGSSVVRALRRGVAGSTVVDRLREVVPHRPDALALPASWRTGSRLVRAVETLERAAGRSSVGRAADEGGEWVRASFLYRWLTAEPEPEVIVIDLRETFTVRPFIVALDEALGVIGLGLPRSAVGNAAERTGQTLRDAPVKVASAILAGLVSLALVATIVLSEPSTFAVVAQLLVLGVAALGLRVDATWDEVLASRPVQLLIAVLEPPEPPEEYHERQVGGEKPDDGEREANDAPDEEQ